MKIREFRLQKGIFIYKTGILFTKVDFCLQNGSLGLQMGLSPCYLPLGLMLAKKFNFVNNVLMIIIKLLLFYFINNKAHHHYAELRLMGSLLAKFALSPYSVLAASHKI